MERLLGVSLMLRGGRELEKTGCQLDDAVGGRPRPWWMGHGNSIQMRAWLLVRIPGCRGYDAQPVHVLTLGRFTNCQCLGPTLGESDGSWVWIEHENF